MQHHQQVLIFLSGDPVLVFCSSRKHCQSCAQLLADLLPMRVGCASVSGEAQDKRKALVTQMQIAMAGFSNTALEKMMLAGMSECCCSCFCLQDSVFDS